MYVLESCRRHLASRSTSPGLIVVRRQLLQQLFNAMLLAHGVHERDLVIGEIAEEEMHLQ